MVWFALDASFSLDGGVVNSGYAWAWPFILAAIKRSPRWGQVDEMEITDRTLYQQAQLPPPVAAGLTPAAGPSYRVRDAFAAVGLLVRVDGVPGHWLTPNWNSYQRDPSKVARQQAFRSDHRERLNAEARDRYRRRRENSRATSRDREGVEHPEIEADNSAAVEPGDPSISTVSRLSRDVARREVDPDSTSRDVAGRVSRRHDIDIDPPERERESAGASPRDVARRATPAQRAAATPIGGETPASRCVRRFAEIATAPVTTGNEMEIARLVLEAGEPRVLQSCDVLEREYERRTVGNLAQVVRGGAAGNGGGKNRGRRTHHAAGLYEGDRPTIPVRTGGDGWSDD